WKGGLEKVRPSRSAWTFLLNILSTYPDAGKFVKQSPYPDETLDIVLYDGQYFQTHERAQFQGTSEAECHPALEGSLSEHLDWWHDTIGRAALDAEEPPTQYTQAKAP
ncbi:MAG: hypothetical protein Q9228_007799, partial [Teloschistes exilis]